MSILIGLMPFATRALSVGTEVHCTPILTPQRGAFITGGIRASVSIETLPLYFAFGVNFSESAALDFPVIVDYRIGAFPIHDIYGWYWGAGGAVNLLVDKSYVALAIGPRVFIGVNAILSNVEVYIQTAVKSQVRFSFRENADGITFPFSFPIMAGMRVKLR